MDTTMRVLVFASQKGGAGKTTLSGHIAVQADLAGAGPVAMIDTDPQGSLATWWNARVSPTPAFVQTEFSSIFHDIERLREAGFKLVIVDTPPAVTEAIAEVVANADIAILPTRPSPHDLRAVGATVDIVESHHKNMIFVVNGATPRARLTSEAAVALSQHGTVAPVTIHQRVDFASSMIDGRTVMETDPEGRSSREILALWEYLETRLHKLNKQTVKVEERQRPAPSHVLPTDEMVVGHDAATGGVAQAQESPIGALPVGGPSSSEAKVTPIFGRRAGR